MRNRVVEVRIYESFLVNLVPKWFLIFIYKDHQNKYHPFLTFVLFWLYPYLFIYLFVILNKGLSYDESLFTFYNEITRLCTYVKWITFRLVWWTYVIKILFKIFYFRLECHSDSFSNQGQRSRLPPFPDVTSWSLQTSLYLC